MLLVEHPDTYAPERTYALEVLFGTFLGLEWKARAVARAGTRITLPESSNRRSLTIADGLFATPEGQWLTPQSLPDRPLSRWRPDGGLIEPTLVAAELPIIYGDLLANGGFYEEAEDAITLGIDIFGSIFFQLTRYEEIVCPTRDTRQRFPAEASLAYREGFLTRPLANEYVEVLWSAMKRLWPSMERRKHTFTELLSHDVDSPSYRAGSLGGGVKAALGDLVHRRDRRLALARLNSLRPARGAPRAGDPYYTFDLIMDLSERRGLSSAFYFMAGTTNPSLDGTYAIDEPFIGDLIRRIDERGHEIGLHPSYESFRDPAVVRREYHALQSTLERQRLSLPAVTGGRQHFLRWENPTTWRAWEQAGLGYDSSLGFPDEPGFRCGVCFDYPAFDLVEREPLRLLERPLVIMEQALFSTGADTERRALETLETLRRRCGLFGGNFTLLWHNSQLASQRQRRLYTRTILGT